jgi:peptide/nickel transport system permease protein
MSAPEETPATGRAPRPSSRVPRFLRTARGTVGLVMLVFVVAVALLGPWVAPYDLDQPIGIPGSQPGDGAPLGTDFLGRDVLSRLLHGGYSVLLLSVIAVVLTYIVGMTTGMIAGVSRTWIDPLLMRTADLFIVFPPLLLLLVLISGAGTSTLVLVIGIVLVMFPGVTRLVRTATLEVSTTSYIEAAIARGESRRAIMRREILPNIAPALIADCGVRFLGAIFLVASLNFLGLGSQPPSANWGLMIAENRQIITLNIWAVLAPALMLSLLTVSVNMIGDAYVHTRDRSGARQ